MFISRPSEPRTVLLWGDRWYFPDGVPSERFAHVKQAAELLAASFAEEPKPVRLRLVFQPDSLESVPVACPHGDRRVIATALAGEFPALREADYSWGFEPVLADGEGFSTILHHETEPALLVLAAELAKLGLAVDSAWPLATFLHALPQEWSDSGATTVIAVRRNAALGYHHAHDSVRSIVRWNGESAISNVGRWLAQNLTERPAGSAILVCEDEESAAEIDKQLAVLDQTQLEALRLSEALGRQITLPRYHPAQLLPRASGITTQHAAIAASVAFFLIAASAGFALGWQQHVAKSAATERQVRVHRLRGELAHIQENATAIAAMKGLIEKGAASIPYGLLLRTISTTLPPEVVLSSFQSNEAKIECRGWAATADALEDWRKRLLLAAPQWKLTAQAGRDGAFVVSGNYSP